MLSLLPLDKRMDNKSFLNKIIYIKEALGKEGKNIRIYKIRTMAINADDQAERVFKEKRDGFGKVINDTRITPFGKFLRRYWLDEIPQLYNLLRGDIKLVGIRPKSKYGWNGYPIEHFEHALKYKPGLFGIQYAYRGDTFRDSIRIEIDYLKQKDKAPFWTDCSFLFKILYNIIFKGTRSR